VPISAKTGKSIQNVLPTVKRTAEVSTREIPTAQLNRWLKEAVSRHEPSMAQQGNRQRPLKFFYATQTSVRPPTFLLFCTEPEAVKTSYRRFLENRLREDFDLRGTPIRLRLRKREQKERKPAE
jgi:GTP-binding protein